MYKEYDGINTLGLEFPKKANGLQLLDVLWEKKFSQYVHEQTRQDIIERTCDKNYKIVDENLEQFIGVYEMPVLNKPEWYKTFIEFFISYATIENLYLKKGYQLVDPTAKHKDFIDSIQDIKTRLDNADYAEGTLTDESNRQVKILKYIKQKLKKIFTISDTEYEKEEMVLYYNKYKEAKKAMYLVITNAIPALLGMSSYGNVKSGEGRAWSSCQAVVGSGGEYTACVPVNLLDPNSLICYITDGITVGFFGMEDKKEYNHYQMYNRTMIRLLNSNGQKILMVDRSYPNAQYTPNIMIKLAELLKGTDITLGIPSKFNSSQSGGDNFSSFLDKAKRNTKVMVGKLTHDILVGLGKGYKNSCENCKHFVQYCTEGFCSNCKDNKNGHCMTKQRRCELCGKRGALSCKDSECDTCQFRPCNKVVGYIYYDDQNGRTKFDSHYLKGERSYNYSYEVVTGLEKNLNGGV